MNLNVDVIVIWLAMVGVAMFSYAVVIPYFIVRRLRRMVASGEMAEMLISALESPVTRQDGSKTTVAGLMVSVAVANLKNQFQSLKSAVVRGVISGDDGVVDSGLEAYIQSVPAKWRWIVPLAMPVLARMQGNAGVSHGGSAVPSASQTNIPHGYGSGL